MAYGRYGRAPLLLHPGGKSERQITAGRLACSWATPHDARCGSFWLPSVAIWAVRCISAVVEALGQFAV
jgi:hypothetical protein